ncbi:MAG: polyribonucleotide nucleotidyltransferase, partial [Myxococcales bacterium]
MEATRTSINIGGKDVIIESGKLAKQAHGSVTIQYGDTVLLVTAVSAAEKKEGLDFFPLTVDYQEKLYAAGRIPGSYFKREGRLTEKETLTSRLIDRGLRPLFPEGYFFETQVIAFVLSSDLQNEPDVHAITAASAALHLSDAPFQGPIAGIRVGRIDGKFVAYPTAEQRTQSDIDLVVAASKDAIMMVEGGSKEISEADMVDALLFAFEQVQPLIKAQEELRAKLGKPKRNFTPAPVNEELKKRVHALAYDKVAAAYKNHVKEERYGALSQAKKEVLEQLKQELGENYAASEKAIKGFIEDLKYNYVRSMVVNEGVRIGGRKHHEIRAIWNEVGVLPRTHGSAVFTRGETQAL